MGGEREVRETAERESGKGKAGEGVRNPKGEREARRKRLLKKKAPKAELQLCIL